jgi:uncharacterized membrane protein
VTACSSNERRREVLELRRLETTLYRHLDVVHARIRELRYGHFSASPYPSEVA